MRLKGIQSFVVASLVILVPFTILILFVRRDLSAEQALSQKLAEVRMRMQYLESTYRAIQEDVVILSQYLGLMGSKADSANITISDAVLESLSPETRIIVKNSTFFSLFPSRLRLPTSFNFLPHLLDDPSSFRPAFTLTKGRTGVSVALGVPTVKRDKQTYLMSTLQNLVSNMDDTEQNETLIVVFIGETDIDYVRNVANQIKVQFSQYVENGLIEVIAPVASYYPNFDNLRLTLGDPPERVKWRSKQNLDYLYLMAYSQTKATFYVQLEDDILATPGFVTIMKNFATERTAAKSSWFVLDFCELGLIGKMFKSADLPWLMAFFQMFYNDEPVDWLLRLLIDTRVCGWGRGQQYCKIESAKYWLPYQTSLFQHVGTTSSLRGKVQTLTDIQFGKVLTFYPHINPPAIVRIAYKNDQLLHAYNGKTHFWDLLPQSGNLVEFVFKEPIAIKRYLFRSGNSERLSYLFYNTTIEVLPVALPENSQVWSTYNSTPDGFLIVGSFNEFGLAEGVVDPKIGTIKEIRLHVHSDSGHWATLNEIHIQEVSNR